MSDPRSAMLGPVAGLLVPLGALACMSAAICAQVGEAGAGDVSLAVESEPIDARAELPQDSPSSSTYSFRERNEQIVRLAFPGLAYCPGAWLWVLDESIEGVPLEGRSLEGRAYFPDTGRGTELIEGVLTYTDDHSPVHSEWFELTITEAVAVGPSDLEQAIVDLQMLRDDPAFERVIRMLDEGAPSDPWWPVAPGTEGTVADAIEVLHRPTTATVSGAIVTNLNPSPVPVGGQITTGTSDAGITTTTFVAMTDTYVPIQKSDEQLMEELSTGWAWLDQIAMDPESADTEAIAATLTRKAERGFEAWDRRLNEAIDELLRMFPEMPDPRDEEWQIPISAADEAALEALLEEAAERGWDVDPLPFVESGILRLIPRAQPINEPMEIPPVPEAPPPDWEIEPIELPCVWDNDCQRCVNDYENQKDFLLSVADLFLQAAMSDFTTLVQAAAATKAAALAQARADYLLKEKAIQAAALLLALRCAFIPNPLAQAVCIATAIVGYAYALHLLKREYAQKIAAANLANSGAVARAKAQLARDLQAIMDWLREQIRVAKDKKEDCLDDNNCCTEEVDPELSFRGPCLLPTSWDVAVHLAHTRSKCTLRCGLERAA